MVPNVNADFDFHVINKKVYLQNNFMSISEMHSGG